MMKTTAQKFPKLQFEIDTGHNCCGQAILHAIEDVWISGYGYTRGADGKEKYGPHHIGHATSKAMLNDFFKRVDEQLDEDAVHHFDRECEENLGCCYAFMSATLYRGQHVYDDKDMIDEMVKRGWKIMQEGKNPKTGNIIVNLGKDL